MTHFFIDVFDGRTKHLDEAGSDLPALSDARAEAITALCDLMRHHLLTRDQSVLRTAIRNAHGAIVYEGILTFTGTAYD